jgi:lipopolysaccharide cholinephosphotransferase
MVDLNIKLPNDFFDEEVRCGYTVTRQMKEVWAVELDLLNELLQVCQKYDIKIFAAGGTLLGAIRHKGFIPWDDDIDMLMFRDDYEKLCKVAKKEFKNPYFFQTEYSDPGSLRGHAQLRNSDTTGILKSEVDYKFSYNQGIFIDIFPWDNMIEDKDKWDKQKASIVRYRNLSLNFARVSTRYIDIGKPFNRKIKKILYICGRNIFKIFARLFYKKFEKQVRMYDNTDCSQVAPISFYVDSFPRYREDFNMVKYVPFESILIPIGSGYDRLLKLRFGDYMKMVNESSGHGNVIFDTNISYKEYMSRTQK